MSDEEDDDAEAADGKKRKKGANKDGADGKDAKRKKPEVDKRDKQRLANMFAKNAAAVAERSAATTSSSLCRYARVALDGPGNKLPTFLSTASCGVLGAKDT